MEMTEVQLLTEFSQYMPHGMCLLWQPWLVILWAGSDLLIFLAYFAIPLALLRVVRRRKDLQHRGLVLLFAAFIMLCGLTHALSIVTLWIPIYPLHGFVKLATGLVSVTTAIVLFRLVPILVSIPSPADLERANESLRREIVDHETTLSALREAREQLEHQVEERTAELKEANAKLAVMAREAVHRSRNLLTVVVSIVRQSARGAARTEQFVDVLLGRLNALAVATATVMETSSRASADLKEVVAKQLEPVLLTFGDRVSIDGPEVRIGSEAAQQISLALHELATNAQKYGSLAQPDAQVRVSWHTDAEVDGEKRLLLRWEEDMPQDAARSVAEAKGGGFGSRLLTRLLPEMLKGEARRTFGESGLVYELDVPLAALALGTSRQGGGTETDTRRAEPGFNPA